MPKCWVVAILSYPTLIANSEAGVGARSNDRESLLGVQNRRDFGDFALSNKEVHDIYVPAASARSFPL